MGPGVPQDPEGFQTERLSYHYTSPERIEFFVELVDNDGEKFWHNGPIFSMVPVISGV